MSLKRLNKRDYQIGLIVTEADVFYCLEILFDAKHDPIVTADINDTNTYSVGEYKAKNIVICYFSLKSYPSAPADIMAKVASNFKIAFPNLLFASVGYSTGAPTKDHDLRLGDVLVSSCSNVGESSGTRDTMTRRAIDIKWQEAHRKSYNSKDIQTIFSENRRIIENKNEGMKKITARPTTDVLYDGIGQVVQRIPRRGLGIGIFNGDIADVLVTTEKQRRDLVTKWPNLMGFDPIAGHIIREIQYCLFIRAVADYGDEKKNDLWHKECAKNSAAYAKYIIGFLDAVDPTPSAPPMEQEKPTPSLYPTIKPTITPLVEPMFSTVASVQKEKEVEKKEVDKKEKEIDIEPILDEIHASISLQVKDMEKAIKNGKKPEPLHVIHILENPPAGLSAKIIASLTADNYKVKTEKTSVAEILAISE
jgi:hypothetical protein